MADDEDYTDFWQQRPLDQTQGIGPKDENFLRPLSIGVGPHPFLWTFFYPISFFFAKHT